MLFLDFFLGLLSLFLGMSSVHASPIAALAPTPTVVDSIKDIQKETAELAATVQHWSGHVIEALNISQASASLLRSIDEATETAKESDKMSIGQALKVKKATKNLLKEIKSSVDVAIDHKILFDHAGLNRVMVKEFKTMQGKSAKLIKTIVDKLPGIGKGIGRRLGRKINKAFDTAIEAFSEDFSKENSEESSKEN
ncbi:hypothetical protein diail_2088 [Diaporthe ilicicola]|nr:hypothetical protein diail_2088 [Diaporthe ilicicola]